MNINYKTVFLALIASLLIAIPTATALNTKSNEAKIERTKANQLQIDLKKRDSTLQKTIDEKIQTEEQLKQKADEAEKLKQQNEQLQKDLQAKRDKQANDAKLAAANAAVRTSGVAGNCESYRGLVAAYFPASQVNNALLTMSKESSCNPAAVSPTHDHGLMQINEVHLPKVNGSIAALHDPETNVRLAAQIYSDRGNWSAWYAVRGILW